MARLLLGSAPMKRLGLGPLLLAAGCLYYQGVNDSPTVTLHVAGATTTIKGAPISLYVDVHDDQPGTSSRDVTYLVAAADGQPLDAMCDYAVTPSPGGATVVFYRTGVFTVSALTKDAYGAGGVSGPLMVEIDDAAPTFAPTAKLVPTSLRNACDVYTAGAPITVGLDGSVSDGDAAASSLSAGCNTAEALTYTFRLVGVPDGAQRVLTPFVNGGCAAPTAASGATLDVAGPMSQVCVWPDVGPPMGSASYTVVLDVGDGTTTTTSGSVDLPVAADQPPCITGTELPAGSYVLDRASPQLFQVTGVADDRDPLGSAQLGFVWSLWRDSDPVWRVVPSYGESFYQLDGSSFGVGEHARLRVEAVDRTGALATCDVAADDCIVSSCAVGSGQCHKWKTWDLELR